MTNRHWFFFFAAAVVVGAALFKQGVPAAPILIGIGAVALLNLRRQVRGA